MHKRTKLEDVTQYLENLFLEYTQNLKKRVFDEVGRLYTVPIKERELNENLLTLLSIVRVGNDVGDLKNKRKIKDDFYNKNLYFVCGFNLRFKLESVVTDEPETFSLVYRLTAIKQFVNVVE